MKSRDLKFKTKFWNDVAASLPVAVRQRHRADLARAERWELALDRAIEAWTRFKHGAARSLQPRGAH
jgi:predicted GTPase